MIPKLPPSTIKIRKSRQRKEKRRKNLYLLLGGIIVFFVLFLFWQKMNNQENKLPTELNFFTETEKKEQEEFLPTIKEHFIENGEVFSKMNSALGLSDEKLQEILEAAQDVYDLSQIKAGHSLRSFFDPQNSHDFFKLEYQIDDQRLLEVNKEDNGQLKAQIKEIEYQTELNLVEGTIEDSLFQSGKKAGLTDKTIIEMADIFAWDINFALEVRAGDKFKVLYENYYLDGEFIRPGKILMVYFQQKDKEHWAVFYQDQEGNFDYYDLAGNNLRKQFLKSPLQYKYISSYYSLKRWHPVWNTYTTHQAIDFAAPCGTPVSAAGNGVITFAGWRNNVYGYRVEINHNGVYKTFYGHLSAFARGINYGTKVSQGQIIGFVGTTGASTGCHLDYAMSKYGQWINPLTQDFEPVSPIAPEKMGNFEFEKNNLMRLFEEKY
jgi:murein DD-endopeptidase MepM/ murein hydrolase activator NlpD